MVITGISSQSLGAKLADPDFLTQVSDFDMVCLVETHENENSSLNIFGFKKVISVYHRKNKQKSSGGIAIFVKPALSKAVIAVNQPNLSTDIVWIKLKMEHFLLQKDVFLGTVYFSPETYEK